MNAEEAKVPDVEGQWESIKIFLFSNGQHYSPPRKYHLRIDELHLWDDTLNALAKSHYGLQSPPINLYTTDGQLVEGPLELKDGLAYVAVTPPDTFIDGGYQKYLIRASRSWEKRQARKKVPECVLEDLCCLCPEKEWCCDLQKCCLCPEKEDEDSLETLLCATGHPELRPAGGHFMSSAPSKPAVSDDYRPKLGKIASTAGEHAVTPGDYGATQGGFGYSPVETPAKPDEYEARLVEYDEDPSEHALRMSENGSRLGELRTRPDEYRAKLNEKTMIPSEYEAYPGEHTATLSKNGASLGEFVEYGARLNENAAVPGEFETRPSVNRAKQIEYRARPGEYKTRPTINGAKPSEYEVKPGEYETRPSVNGARASINAARLGEYEARPSEQEARLGEDKIRRSSNGDRSSEYGVRPGEYETRPTVNGAKPSEYKARSVENETRSSIDGGKQNEYGAQPTEYGTKLGVNGAKPTEYETRPGKYESSTTVNRDIPSEHRARPDANETRRSANGAKPSEYGARTGEYEPRMRENGAKPGEYGTKPSEQGARPAEYKIRRSTNEDKLSEYGVRPGEYEIRPTVNGAKSTEYKARSVENETRSSINGFKPNEYGAKPAQYETRPGENGAKPSEYKARPGENETRPSVNGSKSGDYGARSGAYETTPSINGARPGEYGTKPDEYESRSRRNRANAGEYVTKPNVNGAKSDEYGARPGEYETRPSINGARPAEYRTKPGEYEPRPKENGANKPDEYVSRPSEQRARPGEYKIRHSTNGDNSSEYGVRPGEYETRPGENEAKPSEYKPRVNGSKSGHYGARLSIIGAKSDEYGAIPGVYETRPSINGARPDEYGTRPNVNGAKAGEYRARSGEFVDQSVEQRTQPDEYGHTPAKGGVRSDEDGVRQTVHEDRKGNAGPWSNEIEHKKEAYEIGLLDNKRSLDDNVDRPVIHTVDKDAGEEYKHPQQSSTLTPIDESEFGKTCEYGVTEGNQRDKQIDSKGKASGNGGRGGRRVNGGEQTGRENDTVNGMRVSRPIKNENACIPSELKSLGNENKRKSTQQRGEIEQTRRLSGQAGAEIDKGGRTGELSREFEHGGRVSQQKGRETNVAGRAGVNTARLSEQRNKRSDHLARSGGRESSVSDHEARAGNLGLGSSDHDAGLVNPGSRVADVGARAAVSGSRASPRNKMSSIAKISNMRQPRLGIPGTRVDETAAKVDESEIKNQRVDYPGARQSIVGGTGVAGGSHISEAQQHARRSSLSAGIASTEKKRLSISQNSSLLRKPTPVSSVLRKSEDKQSIKTNKEILPKGMPNKASAIPVPPSNNAGQSKTLPKVPYKHITPPALQPSTIPTTNLVNLATNNAPLENFIDEKEISVVSSTLSFREPESEIRSMVLDFVKKAVDVIKNSPQETQTELIYVEKSKASETVNEEVQTNAEAVEQHRKEVSASNKAKVNSCTCTCALCCKRDHGLATADPDKNIISIQNKGDVINLKLNIEVRNIDRSVYCYQNNCPRSRSLTNVTRSEKDSQISIDDGMFVRRKNSLQSTLNHQYFQGHGFEGSPKLMVVQCAGCGRLNYPPRCDLPPCCDNNKKYFVLLANSLNEDMNDDCYNFNPPRRPCSLRQSQLKKSSSGVPITQTLSEMTSDIITVSGILLQSREMGNNTDTTCQTEEPQGECLISRRKVSISKVSGPRCDYQKESSSSISVVTQVDNLKTKHSIKCQQKNKLKDSQVSSEFCPPVKNSQKEQSVCSQVSSQISPQVQSQGCMPVSPTCSTCCPKLLPCIQVQTQVYLQVPQVSDAQTQTWWNSIVLQARLHPDGQYSFHLPPLSVLKSYPF